MHNKPVAAVFLFSFSLTACGTLFNKGVKTLPAESEPAGAEVYVDGERRCVSPCTLELKNNKDHTIVLKKAGYKDVTCEVRASAKAGWIVLDILIFPVGVIVDAVTGEWKGIGQKTCQVNLPAADGAAQDATAIRGR
ncbi:MAG: PEGA domain-containing protein [Gemmatimonadota bacterium]